MRRSSVEMMQSHGMPARLAIVVSVANEPLDSVEMVNLRFSCVKPGTVSGHGSRRRHACARFTISCSVRPGKPYLGNSSSSLPRNRSSLLTYGVSPARMRAIPRMYPSRRHSSAIADESTVSSLARATASISRMIDPRQSVHVPKTSNTSARTE